MTFRRNRRTFPLMQKGPPMSGSKQSGGLLRPRHRGRLSSGNQMRRLLWAETIGDLVGVKQTQLLHACGTYPWRMPRSPGDGEEV